MSKLSLFDPFDIINQALMLAKHLPVGRVWSAGFNPDSNLGKLIKGLAIEFYRLEVLTQKISAEFDINQTNELLLEWEKSVGIPDDCFSTNTSLEQRRLQVLEKFSNFGGVQKAEDFERVAAVFGYTVTVIPASTTVSYPLFPLTFPLSFNESMTMVRHTVYIQYTGPMAEFFPLEFPIPFQIPIEPFLSCIFDKLAPANVKIIFQYA